MKSLKLDEIIFDEKDDGQLFWKYDQFKFDDLNLIIGPNASGKTQFLKRMVFMREVHNLVSIPAQIRTIFTSKAKFSVLENDIKIGQVTYELTYGPGNQINEKIHDENKKSYFEVKINEATLYDEQTKEMKSFLYNNSVSITKQVRNMTNSFSTICMIGDFFRSILVLQADKFNLTNIKLGKNEIIPSDDMENISAVVLNWKDSYPELYNQLITRFKLFFETVNGFDKKVLANIPGEIIALNENEVKEKVAIFDMSSGMVRILTLLALPLVRDLVHKNKTINIVPSLILIDEVDNGLDYERIGLIIDHLEAESDFIQVVVSSHSPVVCNFINPKNWRIFNRKGVVVKITQPLNIPETKSFVEKSKESNWELYKNHISKSGLYSVN